MMAVTQTRYQLLYDSVQSYLDTINEKNRMAENMNAAMTIASTYENESGNHSSDDSNATFTYTDPETGATSDMTVHDFMTMYDIDSTPSGTSWSKDDWTTAYTTLQTQSKKLESESSMAQTEMYQEYNRLQETVTFASTFESNYHQMMSKVASAE